MLSLAWSYSRSADTGEALEETFHLHIRAATAAAAIVRSVVGGMMPLFALKIYYSLWLAWTNTLLACLIFLLAPISILLVRFSDDLMRRFPVDNS
jgi:hypothetical protein